MKRQGRIAFLLRGGAVDHYDGFGQDEETGRKRRGRSEDKEDAEEVSEHNDEEMRGGM